MSPYLLFICMQAIAWVFMIESESGFNFRLMRHIGLENLDLPRLMDYFRPILSFETETPNRNATNATMQANNNATTNTTTPIVSTVILVSTNQDPTFGTIAINNASTTELLFQMLKNACNFQAFVVVLLACLVLTVWAVRRKGRHRGFQEGVSKDSRQKPSTLSKILRVLQCENNANFETCNNETNNKSCSSQTATRRFKSADGREVMLKPYKRGENFETWLEEFETKLDNFESDRHTPIFKEVVDEALNNDSFDWKRGFDELKCDLIKKFDSFTDQSVRNSLLDLVSCKQKQATSTEAYADELTKKADVLLKRIIAEGVEGFKVEHFIKGLYDDKDKYKLIAFCSSNRANNQACNLKAMINYLKDHHSLTKKFNEDQYEINYIQNNNYRRSNNRYNNTKPNRQDANEGSRNKSNSQPNQNQNQQQRQQQDSKPSPQQDSYTPKNQNRDQDDLFNDASSQNGCYQIHLDDNESNEFSITKPITGTCIMNNTLISYLYDSGACKSLLSASAYEKIREKSKRAKLKPYLGQPFYSFTSKIEILGVLSLDELVVDPTSSINKRVDIVVAKHQSKYDAIIGRDIMELVPRLNHQLIETRRYIETTSKLLDRNYQQKSENDDFMVLEIELYNDVSREEYDKALGIVQEIVAQVATSSLDGFKPNATYPHKIKLINSDIKPIRQKVRTIPFAMKAEFKKMLDDQLRTGIIRPSNSAWASPTNIVKKPDGSIRITIDYKKVNEVTEKDAYPLPNIEQMIPKVTTSRFFTKLDFINGFYQLVMELGSIKYTAFICEFGLYEYNVLPMGLCNSPATFQRVVNTILKEFIDEGFVVVYIDDILIHSKTLVEHIEHVRRVVEKLKQENLKLKQKKCELAKLQVQFLGYSIGHNFVSPNPEKIASIKEYERPRTLQQLQAFLGVTGYYRKFIQNYTRVAKPLLDLTATKELEYKPLKRNGQVNNKLVEIEWSDEATDSFEKLKQVMCGETILVMPNFKIEFSLATDACNYGIGAVLCQDHDNSLKPVAYYSKNLSKSQRNYSTSEKELLAIVNAVEHFHVYLYGTHFIVYSDHKPLAWLIKKENPAAILARWLIRLSKYSFTIKYKKGKANADADGLSRMPDPEEYGDAEEYDEYLICLLDVAYPEFVSNDMPAQLMQTSEEQKLDDDINTIVELILKHGNGKPTKTPVEVETQMARLLWNKYEKLEIVDGILYHSSEDRTGYKNLRFVVPSHLVEDICYAQHASPFSGHLGYKKTISKIHERFYRPGLAKSVETFVKECETCQKVKGGRKTKANLILFRPTRPNQAIACDIAGPFKKTARGNVYLLIVTDMFTKYTEAYPIEDMTAETVAHKIIDEWICRYGLPIAILSDRGKNFKCNLMELIYEYLDIAQFTTTAFHPQCDGQSEAMVKNFKNMLKCFVSENLDDWDLYVNRNMFAYNSSVHSTTRFTPFEMKYGFQPRVPLDIFQTIPVSTLEEVSTNDFEDDGLSIAFNKDDGVVIKLPDESDESIIKRMSNKSEQFLNQLKTQLKQIYTSAVENRDINMDIAKTYYERNLRKRNYEVGELVLVDHPVLKKGIGTGLAHKYYGPFEVKRVFPNGVNYAIQRCAGKRKKLYSIHANRLKKYYGSNNMDNEIETREVEGETIVEPLAPKKRGRKRKKSNSKQNKKAKQGEEHDLEWDSMCDELDVENEVNLTKEMNELMQGLGNIDEPNGNQPELDFQRREGAQTPAQPNQELDDEDQLEPGDDSFVPNPYYARQLAQAPIELERTKGTRIRKPPDFLRF